MKAIVDLRLRQRLRSPLILLSFLTLASGFSVASAGEVAVHGFGTVGAAYVDKPDDWSYMRSQNHQSSSDAFRADLDSVIGLQINYQPTSSVELVGQAAASRLADDAEAGDYLELAFISWRPDDKWMVRLGRVNLDAYLISDHRDVGFTYPFIRPPVEYYSRLPTSLDGGDVTRSWMVGGVQWQTKLFVGRTSGGTGASRLKLWPVIGLVAARESDGLLLRLSALHGRTTNNIVALAPLMQGLEQVHALPVPSVAADAAQMWNALTTRDMRTNYLAAAMAYDRHDWLLSAEINRTRVKGKPWISFTSGYVSAGRRFGALSAFVTQSAAKRQADPFQTPDWTTPLTPLDPLLAQQAQQLAFAAAGTINTTAPVQSTSSLGMRWDVSPRVALKTQWDHVRWHEQGSALWFNADGQRGSANVLAVAADFVF